MNMISTLLRGFIGAYFASLGFGVLFNIRGKSLFFAGLAGGIGGLVYNVLALYINSIAANFFAAAALAVCAEIFSRLLKTTVTTFIACALIPLVPGGTAYKMMLAFIQGDLIQGLKLALDTITIAGMLAIGILFVSILTRFFFFSKERIGDMTELMRERGKT